MVNNLSLGGGIKGISAKPIQNAVRLGQTSSDRLVLRKSMGFSRFSLEKSYTTFRLVQDVVPLCDDPNSADDVLEGNSCKGEVGNTKYVFDSSEFIRFKRLSAKNRNYNDSTFGGDMHNGAQSAYRMRH